MRVNTLIYRTVLELISHLVAVRLGLARVHLEHVGEAEGHEQLAEKLHMKHKDLRQFCKKELRHRDEFLRDN